MPIYTKAGDKGKTALFGGKRLSKASPVIEAYGTIDELSSLLGLVSTGTKAKHMVNRITYIQRDLHTIMACLAGSKQPIEVLSARVKTFEREIDIIQSKLPPLSKFILPGGTATGSWLHLARTVCRRAERRVVALKKTDAVILTYLNRLSDYLFVLGRYADKGREVAV